MKLPFERWLRMQHHTEVSIASYTKAIRRFKEWCKCRKIKNTALVHHNHIMVYIRDCSIRGMTRRSIAHYITMLKKYYYWLMVCGKIFDNPCCEIYIKGIKRRSLHDILTMEELEKLYACYPTAMTAKDPSRYSHSIERINLARVRCKLILGFIIYQALAIEEIMQLTIDDIDLNQQKTFLKGARYCVPRTLDLNKKQLPDLQYYIEHTRLDMLRHVRTNAVINQLFFPLYGGPDNHNLFEPLLRHIKGINSRIKCAEQLRASVLVHWLTVYDIRKVRRMAGHRTITATEMYMEYNLHDLKNDIANFHPF